MEIRECMITLLFIISVFYTTDGADCGNLTASNQVQSLNYTPNTNGEEMCRWTIASAPMEIHIKALLGDDCQYNNVTVYKGESTWKLDVKKTWCGSDTSSYESIDSNLTVVAYTASGQPYNNVLLRYRKLFGPDETMYLKPIHKGHGLEGSIIFLNCSATCYPQCTYRWKKNGDDIDFGTDTVHKGFAEVDGSLHLHDVARNDAGIYTCTAINPSTSTTSSASLTVRVFYGPENNSTSIQTMPSTGAVVGESYSFNCSADCSPPCTYTWRFGGTVLLFDKAIGIIEIENVTLNDAGLYTCTAINPETGKTGKLSANLGLFHGPDSSTSVSKLSSSAAEEGESYSLNCSAVCFPPCRFSWTFRDSLLLANSPSGLLVINNVRRTDAGLYTCTASNYESKKTGNASVQIQVLLDPAGLFPFQPVVHNWFFKGRDGPDASMTLTSTSPDGKEEFSRIDLNCTASCNPSCRYEWKHNGAAIQYREGVSRHQVLASTLGDVHLHNVIRRDAGEYTCMAINSQTHTTWSKSITVKVFYGPDNSTSVLKLSSSAAEEGKSYSLNCSAVCFPPCRFSWTFRDSLLLANSSSGLLVIPDVSRKDAGLYTCTASNYASMKSGSNSTDIGLFYGPDNIVLIERIPNKTPVVGESYTLNCSADCVPACMFNWTLNGVTVLSNSPSGLLVFNDVTKDRAGHYTCTARNEKTLSDAAGSVDLEINYMPVIQKFEINTQSDSVDVEELHNVHINCTVDSDPPSTLQLLNGTTQIKMASNSTEIRHDWAHASCEDTGDYFCSADNGIGDATTKKTQLFVKCSPRLNYHTSFTSKVSAVLGSDVILNLSVIAYPRPTFNWYKMENELLNTSSSVPSTLWSALGQLLLKKTKMEDEGVYHVFVSNGVSSKLFKITLTVNEEETESDPMPAVGITAICISAVAVPIIVVLVVLLLRRRAAANQNGKTKTNSHTNEADTLDPDYMVAVSPYDHLNKHGSTPKQPMNIEDREEHYDSIGDHASLDSSDPVYRGESNSAQTIKVSETSNGTSEVMRDFEGPKQGFEVTKRSSFINPDIVTRPVDSEIDYLTAVDTYGHLRRCPIPPAEPFTEEVGVNPAMETEGPKHGYKIHNCAAFMTLGTDDVQQPNEPINYDDSTTNFEAGDNGSSAVKRNSSINETIRMFEDKNLIDKQAKRAEYQYDNTLV